MMVAEQIRQLHSLRFDGALTDAEYERAKAVLLARLNGFHPACKPNAARLAALDREAEMVAKEWQNYLKGANCLDANGNIVEPGEMTALGTCAVVCWIWAILCLGFGWTAGAMLLGAVGLCGMAGVWMLHDRQDEFVARRNRFQQRLREIEFERKRILDGL